MTTLMNMHDVQLSKGDDSKRDNLEYATNTLERTIDAMAQPNGVCIDVHHMHSFRSVQFLLFPRTCAGCGLTISTSITGIRPVQCISCKVYAHRSCAFSKTLVWPQPCQVNTCTIEIDNSFDHSQRDTKDVENTNTIDGNVSNNTTTVGQHSNDSMNNRSCEEKDFDGGGVENTKQEVESEGRPDDKSPPDQQQQQREEPQKIKHNTYSIFRFTPAVNRDTSLLDSSMVDSTTAGSVTGSSMHVLRLSKSDDGILERLQHPLPELHSSSSVSLMSPGQPISTPETDRSKTRRGISNFPFLSASKLFENKQQADNLQGSSSRIQQSLSWDATISHNSHSTSQQSSSVVEVPSESIVFEVENGTTSVTRDGVETKETEGVGYEINLSGGEKNKPSDHGKDWFKQLSEALQENVIATFHPIVGKRKIPSEELLESNTPDDDIPTNVQDDDSQEESSSSMTPQKHTTNTSNPQQNEQEEDHQTIQTTDNSDKHNHMNESNSMKELVEEVSPEPDPSVARKRLGIATVVGGITGGVAGLAMAGPVGFVVGIKCGQVSGLLGLLLEGSLTVGALVGGVAAGAHTGQQLQDKIEETRVLALGVGTQRKLLLVRPNIQEPEPIWADYYKEARQSFAGSGSGIVQRFLSNEKDAVKRERYERDLDIVQTEEEEIPTSDKVLLLVSRTLNNKDSLPGHIYRCLIEKFRKRALDVPIQKGLVVRTEDCTTEQSNQLGSEGDIEYSKTRRQDAHAVIKYVTATLIEVRPGFASTPTLTEITATAVESLVFGEVYSYVIDEIEAEFEERDGDLLEKIAAYERLQHPTNYDNHNEEGQKKENDGESDIAISEKALESLRYLPEAHSAADKIRYCVNFLERISDLFSESQSRKSMGADSLLKMVCQHIVAAKLFTINAQVAFLEEFARDEILLRGMEGYALVTLAASLHFLNGSSDFQRDVFGSDDEDDGDNTG